MTARTLPNTPTAAQLVARHYLIAALWADSPEGTTPRVTQQAQTEAQLVADRFLYLIGPAILQQVEQAHAEGYGAHPDCGTDRPWLAALGHDLWLTSQGHGAGFWDRDTLPEPLGKTLTTIAKRFAGVYPEFYRGWLYLYGGAE